MHVVETAQCPDTFARVDDVHGSVRGAEKHVFLHADHVRYVRVDHTTMTRDNDTLAWTFRDDAFDRVHAALAEVEARFREGIDVPAAFVPHALSYACKQRRAQDFRYGAFGRDVAKHFDLTKVVDDGHLQRVMERDLMPGVVGALQVAAIDRVDAFLGEAMPDERGLLASDG